MLQVVFNIHVEMGNYYSKSTFIMTQEKLMFIYYIQEYLCVFTKLFEYLIEDFQKARLNME